MSQSTTNEKVDPKERRLTGPRRGEKVAYGQLLGSSNCGRREVGGETGR